MTTGVNIAGMTTLLQHYLDDVVDTLNYNSELRQLVGSEYSWTGNELEWRVHGQRNTGSVGYSTDGASWPTPTLQTYATAKAGRRFMRLKLQLTDGAVATGAAGKGVAVDVVEDEMRRGMADALHFEDFFYARDGSGVIGTLAEALDGDGTNVACDPGFGGWDGQDVLILDTDLSTEHGRVQISTVEGAPDANGNVLVNFSGAVASTADGDYVIPVIAGQTMYNKAITGLDKLIDDSGSTFQNVTLANYPRYTSYVSSNSNALRNLTPRLFRQVFAALKQRSGSDANTSDLALLMTNTMGIEFEELYEGEIRLDPSSETVGLPARRFVSALGTAEIKTASNALPNKIFFVDRSQITRVVQKPMAWHSEAGGMAGVFRMDHSTAVYTAVASEICNLMIKKRHTSAKISDLSEDLVTAFGW